MIHSDLITRPLTLDDAHEYAKTATAIAAHIGANAQFQPEHILIEWQEPNYDISRSAIGIFSGSALAGYAVIWDRAEKPVHPWVNWGVHPDFIGKGLSAQLLGWVDVKGGEIMKRCPPEARFSLLSEIVEGYAPKEDALKQAGYVPDRSAYEMRIEMTQAPPAPDPPDGIIIRSYREADLEGFVHAFRDSFSDHFGYIEEPFEKDLEEFRHWFSHDKQFDPNLTLLALDETSGAVVGCLVGLKADHRHADVGLIELLGVRRAYRRRGLAQTLLVHAFAIYWQRGRRTVGLGVDGESLTNAVALYERVGMSIHRRYMTYEKVLRAGLELAKTSLD